MTAPALALPLCERVGGPAEDGSTLDAVVTTLWDGVLAHREVACPVCGGPMSPRYGAGPLPVAGRCSDCGSVLS